MMQRIKGSCLAAHRPGLRETEPQLSQFDISEVLVQFARILLLALILTSAQPALAALGVNDVRWSQPQFNPTIGGRTAVTFALTERARVSVRVVGMNGVAVRSLSSNVELAAGKHELPWDGRDDAGSLVPDGAYQPVVEAAKRRERAVHATRPLESARVIPVRYYDRRTGMIAYDLPSASYVQILATGQSPDGGTASKLVTSAAARPAGAVIDPWDGLDQSGATRIPDLPGFTIRIEATLLPADAVLTYGHRSAAPAASASPHATSGAGLHPRSARGDH